MNSWVSVTPLTSVEEAHAEVAMDGIVESLSEMDLRQPIVTFSDEIEYVSDMECCEEDDEGAVSPWERQESPNSSDPWWCDSHESLRFAQSFFSSDHEYAKLAEQEEVAEGEGDYQGGADEGAVVEEEGDDDDDIYFTKVLEEEGNLYILL